MYCFRTWVNTREAEKYYKKALEAQERVLGAEHPNTLVSVGNMGVLLSEMGNEEAEKYYKRALEAQERVLGVEHPNTLLSVVNTGKLFSEMGNNEEAEVLQESLGGPRTCAWGRTP